MFLDLFFDGVDLVALYDDYDLSLGEKIGWTPFVLGPMTSSVVRKGGKIVIGETAKRVARYANKISAEHYVSKIRLSESASATQIARVMKNNYQWLYNKVKKGYEIIDIGLDSSRSKRGIFYQAEKRWLELWEME